MPGPICFPSTEEPIMLRLNFLLFYTYYRWARALGFDNTPENTALFNVTVLEVLNLNSLEFFTRRVLGMDLMISKNLTWVPIGLGLFVLNYVLLIKGGKWRTAVKSLDEDPRQSRCANNMAAILWMVVTFVAFVWRIESR
jgi:hypothetical protein